MNARTPRGERDPVRPLASAPDSPGRSGARFGGRELYALVFGIFLGLAIVKFGNPAILDQRILPPQSLSEAWRYAWPARWAYWILVPLAVAGGCLAVRSGFWRNVPLALKALPLTWFGWQLVSATQSVDPSLTSVVLWQFGGCLACYFGGMLIGSSSGTRCWLWIGLLAGFAFCTVRAVNQHLFEFPQERQALVDGERTGWTNFTPEVLVQLKQDHIILTTNGVDVANPVILEKYAKGRVHGTLVYPNALAGIVLLLWPVSIALAVWQGRAFRKVIRACVIAMTLFLGGASLFWTGSKLGWLIALALAVLWLMRLRWSAYAKGALVIFLVAAGLSVFAVRFHNYFAAGATSVGARFDYWRAAVRITADRPLTGTGPGTFQRPYERLKSPSAEMARLAHNDYLEQFSDSGIIGGVSYLAWIVLALAMVGRRAWRSEDVVLAAAFVGVLGWFVQGFGEFSLYVPALAWCAFTLLGWVVAETSAKQIDKPARSL